MKTQFGQGQRNATTYVSESSLPEAAHPCPPVGTILTADAEFTNPGAELLLALVLELLVRLTADEDAFRLALFASSPRRLAPTLPTV